MKSGGGVKFGQIGGTKDFEQDEPAWHGGSGILCPAGACIVFALPPYSILPLGMVAFAVLSLLLRDAAPMRALGLGYLFGR